MIADNKKLIKSPLNYTGGKYRLLEQILPLFPDETETFIDLFCGGCNVGINVLGNKIICIDNEKPLIRLLNSFKLRDKEEIFNTIYYIIKRYNLSNSSKYGYEYYDCVSSSGLSHYNKERYLKLRDDYNNRSEENFYYDILFYTMTIYSFNNHIRFNRNGKFNIPVGKRDFNESVEKKLSYFIDGIKKKNIHFILDDFREVDFNTYLDNSSFVYADPPYLITNATYNEQNKWDKVKEFQLLNILDDLNEKNVKFALSNVLETKGKRNEILIQWSKKYNINYLNYNYNNSNYHRRDKKSNNIEVLITNY
ncbi:MAG: Dam family site-specific DNA-(adenine-N6)-methyltransferase [Clostridiaceae bacterium]|nr:Dam family site-specific DNA-(adenine-N6)-methyltransferase [Clostridiaceae bacterium]MBW4860959.1 Dam family site-specific DNA-(adenine-N6)-methyltransferase [Clostridiaceae bacterium]MBW4867584.1 Dam family site-specific DNA-(adenine-N6)-methyltransferase [Clostridiaceae bacterium]